MSRTIKCVMAFNGASYHGFQRQPNAPTIQGELEKALLKVLHQPVTVHGCSRTDAGVHAREFCFHAGFAHPIPCDGLLRALNTLLPSDIVICSCTEAEAGFHARFACIGKEYQYLINTGAVRDVFMENQALHYPYPLNIDRMQSAGQLLVGTHDFAAFCRAEAKARLESTVRTVTAVEVRQAAGAYVAISVSGTGFLHNMVRIIVGTLLYVSEGKRTEADILAALQTGKREYAGLTAPPHGLYLNRVDYDA